MADALETLRERGFIDNVSDEAGLREAYAESGKQALAATG